MVGQTARTRLSRRVGSVLVAMGVALSFAAATPPAFAGSAESRSNGAAASPRSADRQPLALNGGWQGFSFTEVATVGAVLRLSAPGEAWLRVTDYLCAGYEFLVLDNGVPLGNTSTPTASSCDSYTSSLARAETGAAWSSGGWLLAPGWHTITIIVTKSPFGSGGAAVRADAPAIATARLTGAAEVPGPGDPDGGGVASTLVLRREGGICHSVLVDRIGNVVGGHIHEGSARVAGPIVVDLGLPTGFRRSFAGCVPVERALLRAIAYAPWNYYVNVHTVAYPAGAIRGQLVPPR